MGERGRRDSAAEAAIGYVRVSTEEQAAFGVSLDAQRAKIADYCALHGLDLLGIHADEGLSARRADDREGLLAAIEEACGRKGALVVYSLSRLARSTRDAIDIAERLERCGADLVSITEKIDTTTGIGRFFFTTIAALAQLERDQISERTRAAMAHKRRRGERVSGRLPFGFDLGDDGTTLVPNAREQRAIRRMRRWRSQGKTSREIIALLEKRGIGPKYADRWHPRVVLRICQREQIDTGGGLVRAPAREA